MANGSRGNRSIETGKVKGNNTSGSGSGSKKVLAATSSGTTEASGLRRSGRETAWKSKVVASPLTTTKASSSTGNQKMTSVPSPTTPHAVGTRRSERLDKRTVETALEERKPKRVALGGRSSSPMRRSERVKSMSNSSPVEAKKMEVDTDTVKGKKERKEKSVNQLTEETGKGINGNQQCVKPARVVTHAHAFMALLNDKAQKKSCVKDQSDVLNMPDKLSRDVENPSTTCGSDRGDQRYEHSERKEGELECSERKEGGPEFSEDSERGTTKQYVGVVDKSSPTLETSTEETLRESGNMELSPASPKNVKDPCKTETREETQDIRLGLSSEEEACCSVSSGKNLSERFCQEERGELKAGKALVDTNECRSNKETQKLLLDVHGDDDCNTCFICKLGGDLLNCEGKGCKRSSHLHCLDPPLTNFPYGTWYCIWCVKKKIKFGVHVVSKGIESILDAREIDVGGNKEAQKQKQYYVKYKGLAHVHNHWVTESELLHEALSHIEAFGQIMQFNKWKPEWSVPQRILQKRQLIFSKQLDEYCEENNGECLNCQYEWLVKWCGLDYDQVSWELESSQFLNTPQAQRLKKAYEDRHKTKSDARALKKKGSFSKLSKLPAGFPPESANNCLDSINKLRGFWYKGQNAVLIEDSDRMLKVILFIVSLESCISRPVLIIASPEELLRWERELLHFAPSISVVVYSGNKDIRRCIRTLENFDERDKATFQVLITTGEILTEDTEVLVHIGWEILFIDECLRSDSWVHFDHSKRLTTEMRVLLVNGQLKETVGEYCNLLSLLNCRGGSVDRDGLKNISSHDIISLKNKISRYVVQESLHFVEYWVPAQASNVQVEQFCATLLSNSLPLCSSSKKDPVEALCDIIISNRKCCDHPYLVDSSIQKKMLEGLPPTEYLEVGIKACGKLQLLDSLLSEMKKRGLRVVILFQSVGINKESICIGDILDDYMRQQFGSESYERIDVLHSKKQTALDKFNNKESGRFVLLLESRACSPSIKLESFDAIIIYGSDWMPSHDFKSLQKLTLKSQLNQIKIFRLYSSYTLEEKVLIHVKEKMTVDSPQNMFRNTNHKLLMWGASYLFKRLENFHSCNGKDLGTSISSQDVHLKDVVTEFSAILDGCNRSGKYSIISTVGHNGIEYSSDNLLLGETEMGLSDEMLPHLYWAQLLEAKNPQWKYASGSTQRNRKRAHHTDDPAKKMDVEIAEVSKKRKKVVKDQGDVKLLQNNAKMLSGDREGRENLQDAQKSFHHALKSEVLKLCKALHLSDDVKRMVREFLSYVMTNHHVPDKPATVIQAFQMALCWTAASLLMQKIDHKASLTLAKENFSYECTSEEAERVYSKLRCLKSIYLLHSGVLKVADSSASGVKDSNEIITEGTSVVKIVERDISKTLRKIEKKCNRQMSKLLRKQEEERKELLAICEYDRGLLDKGYKLDAAVIRFSNESSAALLEDKLKSLSDDYKKRYDEHEKEREMRLRCLDEIQLDARKKEEKRAQSWVEEVKSWAQNGILEKLSSNGLNKFASTCDNANQTPPDIIEFVEDTNEWSINPESNTYKNVVCQDSTELLKVSPSGVSGNLYRKVEGVIKSNNKGHHHGCGGLGEDIEHISAQAPESAAVRSCNGQEKVVDADKLPNELEYEKSIIPSIGQLPGNIMPEPSTICRPEDDVISEIPQSVKKPGDSDGLAHVPVNKPSIEVASPSGTSSDTIDRQCSSGQPTVVGASDCINGVTSVSLLQAGVQQTCPSDGGSHGNHVIASAGLPSTLSSTTSVNSSINDLPNQEPTAEPIELMEMQMPTSLPDQGVGPRQYTCEKLVLGPLTSPGGSQPQQSSEVCRPFQTAHTPVHLSGNIMSPPIHTAISEPARVPVAVYSNPLQSELERILKAIDDNNKLQQEKKLQLESDCEKEIAEVVTQIRNKYEVKYQDIETEYSAISKELERNHEKVLMNKILAEAFKCKCTDVKPPSAPGFGQDRNPNFRQQLGLHLSSQQMPRGHSSVINSSVRPPTSNSQNTAVLRLPHIIPPAVGPVDPPVQGIRHSSAPLLSIPPRPAEANFLPPPSSTQMGVVIRTMAPTLQHNRSSVPMSTTRTHLLSHATSSRPLPNNPTVCVSVPVQLTSQIEPQASSSVPYGRPQQPNIAAGLPGIPDSTAIPPEFSPVPSSSNIMPQLVHMSPDLAVQCKTSTQDRMQSTSACTTEANIVCLSDDD